MKAVTTSAHVEPDTKAQVSVFPATGERRGEPFVCLRIGAGLVEIALIARPGTSVALLKLAAAATEAAGLLDDLTANGPEVIV